MIQLLGWAHLILSFDETEIDNFFCVRDSLGWKHRMVMKISSNSSTELIDFFVVK